ncbi:MAG: hypothetical protein WC533_02475 [Candidatus Pacearchaeota archaeon]
MEMVPEEERSEQEKLEEEIAELKNRIKNTEYDLANMFKGNSFLEQKLVNSKKQLDEKKGILEQIKQNPMQKKNLDKIEAGLDEEDVVVSKEQEDFLNEEIEEEL